MFRFLKRKAWEWYEKVFRPIPEEFHSFETGKPFTECIECNGDLTDEDSDYVIEKGFHENEVIFEYAMCEDCAKGFRCELSKESLKHVKRMLRRPKMKETTDGCRMCALPRHELLSYTIIGSCVGPTMMYWSFPMLICGDCMEKILEGLSKQSRDAFDDFEERNFPGPPASELDIPRPKRVMLV